MNAREVALTLLLVVMIGALIGTVSIRPEAEAQTSCQQYADKAVEALNESRRYSASWAQVEAVRGLAYATMYSGCRVR